MNKDRYGKKVLQELAPYLSLGWQMVVTILLMVVIGYYLDKYLESSPIFLVILSLIGCAIGMYEFIRGALKKRGK